MVTNKKFTELEATTSKINLLIEQLKEEISVQQNKNKQLKKLKEIIYDYSHENSQHFTASYNVGRLKAIIHHMFGIIEQQDKRISDLERK
jgi:hypothetical protein